jgi:hypothetical protein
MEHSNGHKPKYAGVPVYMDGREWIIPALSLRQFREHYETLRKTDDLAEENWKEILQTRLPIVLLAIQRNYPDMTEEQLLDMIDLNTFLTVVKAIASASGLRPAQPGE